MNRNSTKLLKYASTFLLIFVLILSTPRTTKAQEAAEHNRFSVGLMVGSWKPNTLSDEPTVSPFGAETAKPYYGLCITTPEIGSYALRIGLGLWAYDEAFQVFILPLTFDFKNYLIGRSSFSPYVNYGAALYFGAEKKLSGLADLTSSEYETGYGINLGVGFDWYLFEHFFVFAEFDFHYVKFKELVGSTADYSGPKLMAGLQYMF